MATVTIIKDGKPATVDETTPGLFGRLGYQYADTPTGLPQLPQGGGGQQEPSLPSSGGGSPLLSFASSLDAAVNLARQKRNKTFVGDIMGPMRGTVKASDFNDILGNFNAASDSTTKDLLKRATDVTNPDIITATSDNGDVHGIDKATGKVVWTAPGVGNKDNGSGGGSDTLVHSGDLTYSRGDYADDSSSLEQSRGSDGWVDPTIYQQLYNAWISKGGKISDFINTYPPDKYVNPENDWLPPYLRPKSSGVSNPFAQ